MYMYLYIVSINKLTLDKKKNRESGRKKEILCICGEDEKNYYHVL